MLSTLFAITILLGAFLLFQVQPLIARYILPWFGGSPAVWTTAMLFFQVALLAGYTYAHLSIQRLKPRTGAIVHSVLLALALIQLPIIPDLALRPTADQPPTWAALGVLALTIGLPYLALSATAPLVQAWFSRAYPGRSPYRLYALSNAGSLTALVSFPFVFEPNLVRNTLAWGWSGAYLLFAILCGLVAFLALRQVPAPVEGGQETEERRAGGPSPSWRRRITWLGLSGTAVILLLASTNQMSQDIAVIPFLWVMPLAVYLLTFIIAFDAERWYIRPLFMAMLIPAVAGVIMILIRVPNVEIVTQIVGYTAALFVFCMVCHGELARLKPDPRYLTGFYLTVSLGGALGGVFVAIIAPVIFTDYWEMQIGLGLVVLLALITILREETPRLEGWTRRAVSTSLVGGFIYLSVFLFNLATRYQPLIEYESRNFYGVLSVLHVDRGTDQERLQLVHGVIDHGSQFVNPVRKNIIGTYFYPTSGIGRTINNVKPAGEPRRVGIVGLGIGTLSAYGKPGDVYRLYEINPSVITASQEYFTYLESSEADITIIPGDGRLSLENEPDQHFDVIVLDAFTSDAVPVHLLTVEAFETYLRHLNPDGVIAANIINRHLDLAPVLRGIADHYGLYSVEVWADGENSLGFYDTRWALLTANPDFIAQAEILSVRYELGGYKEVRLWTDDYTSLFPLVYFDD